MREQASTRNAALTEASQLENGTVFNRFAGYFPIGDIVQNAANAIPADTIGRVEILTLVVIGLNTFFFVRDKVVERCMTLYNLALPQHHLLRRGLAQRLDHQLDNFR